MDLILAYLAGLLTLINPCVLPVLPIVLASAMQAGRAGPAVLALGMGLSFVIAGFTLTAFGPALGIDERHVSRAGAILMIAFGAILLVPRWQARFATATAGLASAADARIDSLDRHALSGQFLGGLLLGAVWSPCIGPTLGGAIALASQGENLAWALAIMVAFALGVGSIVLALGYGARRAILSRQQALRRLAEWSRPILGGVLLLTGLAILFRLNHMAEGWLLDRLPDWLTALSVSL